MKKNLAVLIFGCLFVAFCSAQSAQVITDILNQEKSQWDSLTYLAYYMDENNATSGEELTTQETFDFFYSRGYIPQEYSASSIVRHDELSLFLLKTYSVPANGLLYSIFQNRRYAFRQMQHMGMFLSSDFPSHTMSGGSLVTFMGDFLTMYPSAKLTVQ